MLIHPVKISRDTQTGAALIILLLTLTLAGSTLLISNIYSKHQRLLAQNNTSAALAKAKRALIAYAVTYYFTQSKGDHAFLPCPETVNSSFEGLSTLNCAIGGARHVNQLGRLPWKTLQIDAITDGSGECLWYALSGSFSPSPRALMLNDDTPGMFTIYEQNGTLSQGGRPEDRVAAIIIAPELPLKNQKRINASTNLHCKTPHNLIDVKNYLESTNSISNISINNKIPDQLDEFIRSQGTHNNPNLNDRIISISTNEIFQAIKSKHHLYHDKITSLGIKLSQCLVDYSHTAAANSAATDNICTQLTGCYLNCADISTLCLASSETKTDKKLCRNTYVQCNKSCVTFCLRTQIKNSPTYHFPWPADIDLKNNYRSNKSYSDQLPTNGHLGRLPFLTPLSSASISSRTSAKIDDNVFQSCALASIYPEHFNLWENWKDHWFYVVGKDFSPTANSPPSSPCINCPKVNNKNYAAILIFSGERKNNQLRRSAETENNTPGYENSKANLNNYLEGKNLLNFNDVKGNGTYSPEKTNDRLFCIPEDLTPPVIVEECGF